MHLEKGSSIMKKIGETFKMMFIFEVLAGILFLAAYGVEGTARVFCDTFNAETCNDIDWSE
jgi:thiamine transporter ThiT